MNAVRRVLTSIYAVDNPAKILLVADVLAEWRGTDEHQICPVEPEPEPESEPFPVVVVVATKFTKQLLRNAMTAQPPSVKST